MPTEKKAKRAVRARMEKTGESYTAARAALLPTSSTTKISVEELTPERIAALRERARLQFEIDADERALIERACVRLAAALPAGVAILCRDPMGEELAIHGDLAFRERMRRRFAADQVPWQPYTRLSPIELVDAFDRGDELLCLRRVDGLIRPSNVRALMQLYDHVRLPSGLSNETTKMLRVVMHMHKRFVQIAVAFRASEIPLALLQLHLGHAALAIEQALTAPS